MRNNLCWAGRPHLAGARRRDGSLVCARCQQQLETPSAARGWGTSPPTADSGRLQTVSKPPESKLETAHHRTVSPVGRGEKTCESI